MTEEKPIFIKRISLATKGPCHVDLHFTRLSIAACKTESNGERSLNGISETDLLISII